MILLNRHHIFPPSHFYTVSQKSKVLLWLRKVDYNPYEDGFVCMGCFVSVACIFLLCVYFANILIRRWLFARLGPFW